MAAARYLDVDPDEDLENDSPIHGVHEAEDLTAELACAKAKAACPALTTWDLNLALAAAGRAVCRPEKEGELGPLTREEALSVHIYTQDSSFYKEVNRLLRRRERDALKPFFPYLKLFLTGLHRLTPIDDTVFRGVKLDLSGKYSEGDDIIWWAFSSATATAAVLNSDEFLGCTGPRTLFSIKVYRAVNIRKYSAIGTEDERLILPASPFTVKPHLNLGGGLTMIQIEEDRAHECPPLISGFSFSVEKERAVKPAALKAQAAKCSTAVCTQAAWNGQPGETCCRTCAGSRGAAHGRVCEEQHKMKQGPAVPLQIPKLEEEIHIKEQKIEEYKGCSDVAEISTKQRLRSCENS